MDNSDQRLEPALTQFTVYFGENTVVINGCLHKRSDTLKNLGQYYIICCHPLFSTIFTYDLYHDMINHIPTIQCFRSLLISI